MKLKYVEQEAYLSKSMREILERAEKKSPETESSKSDENNFLRKVMNQQKKAKDRVYDCIVMKQGEIYV